MIQKLFLKIISIMLVMATLVGCSSAPPPSKVVENFFKALQENNYQEIGKYIEGDTDKIGKFNNEDEEKLTKAITSKLKYEIVSTENKGNEATVKVKVTAPDLLKITSKTISELMGIAFATAFSDDSQQLDMEKLTQQYFLNSVSDPNAPMVTTEVDIKLVKKDNAWYIQANDDLLNAITGNMAKAFGELQKIEQK